MFLQTIGETKKMCMEYTYLFWYKLAILFLIELKHSKQKSNTN